MEEIVFPNQIRINRKMRGVSMQDLADRLGISLSAISKIEKGYRRLNQEQLILVAEVLDCSLQDLYVNEQNSQHDVVMAWKKEQERRQEINKMILADFLTIQEHFGALQGKKLVYMGDARYNMGNSLMVGCAKMGMHFVACAPQTYFPDAALIETCQKIAAGTGATLDFDSDPMHAVTGADVIYTDVWVSMGEPDAVWQTRIHDLLPYQVNAKLMAQAGPQCRFMHCLPAFHDLGTTIGKQISEKYGRTAMEVTDEVFESPQSIVFDEAENRMHTIKAVMAATLA